MKCFQTIFSNSFLLTSSSSHFFRDVSLARLGRFDVSMQKKHTILCWIFEPTFQFLSYIIYKLLHTELYASVLAGFSFSSTSAVLARPFLILHHSTMSTAKQIKNEAGHKAKCIVVLGLILKRDRHNETKG